jgi:amino acid permease
MTGAILLLGWLIAMFVKDLSIVLGFVGAVGSTTICYTLPGILYWKLGTSQIKQYLALALFLFGILFLILSVSFQILEVSGVLL